MYEVFQSDHPLVFVLDELQRVDGMIQLGVAAVCIALSWIVGTSIRRRLSMNRSLARFVAVSELLPPIFAWLLLVIVGIALVRWTTVSVLALIAQVFGALALARLVVFILRRSFPASSVLAAFEWAIALSIWSLFVLHITRMLPATAEFLEGIALPVGKQAISVLAIVQGGFLIVLTVLLALWIGTAVDARLMRAETLHSSLRAALSRLARSVLVLIAILIVLPLVGIDLTVLSVFGGALGVGLGFGLQKIASNYMSGFIVLFERSVRINDVVTVDGFSGEVRTLTTRYVVLRSLDGREAIIPNEKLITDTVINHSYTDPRIRASTLVQVTYDTDIDRVFEMLNKIAAEHPRVLEDPPPMAMLTRFADSGIDVELGFWISDPENGTGGVKSDINLAIWRIFKRDGIEFAFPRQDVRMLDA
ncbi:MAG: mechanosensitive ion channel family protein [Burkholderiales bacterium]